MKIDLSSINKKLNKIPSINKQPVLILRFKLEIVKYIIITILLGFKILIIESNDEFEIYIR